MISKNMHEAKSRLSEIVIAAGRGEKVIICRNDKSAVGLVGIPVEPEPPLRDLIPQDHLRTILAAGFNPNEALDENEWPSELQ